MFEFNQHKDSRNLIWFYELKHFKDCKLFIKIIDTKEMFYLKDIKVSNSFQEFRNFKNFEYFIILTLLHCKRL